MKIVRGYPPNFKQIAAAFPDAKGKGVIFTYGDTVYNPTGPSLSRGLQAHEAVHVERQLAFEGGAAAWWTNYIAEPHFRFTEEFQAHLAEFKAWRPNRIAGSRAGALHQIALRLSGPLYGRVMDYGSASRLILEAA